MRGMYVVLPVFLLLLALPMLQAVNAVNNVSLSLAKAVPVAESYAQRLIEVRASDIPVIVGVPVGSIRMAVYDSGRWVHVPFEITGRSVKALIAGLNVSVETTVRQRLVRPSDRIRLRVPSVSSGIAPYRDWCLEAVRARLHYRALVELVDPASREVIARLYVYYDPTVTAAPLGRYIPAPQLEELNGTSGESLLSLYNTPLPVRARVLFEEYTKTMRDPITPDEEMDGGGGGSDLGNTWFSVTLFDDEAFQNTGYRGKTKQPYLGYKVAYAYIWIRAYSNGDYVRYLIVKVNGEEVFRRIVDPDADNIVEEILPLPYTDDEPLKPEITVTVTTWTSSRYPNATWWVTARVLFKCEREGVFAKPYKLIVVDNWYDPVGLQFEEGGCLFLGVEPPQGFMENPILHVEITHRDPEPDAPEYKRFNVSVNGHLLVSENVPGQPLSQGREYHFEADWSIPSSVLAVSLKQGTSLELLVEVEDAYNPYYDKYTSVRAYITGEFMPEVWRDCSDSYVCYSHEIGGLGVVIYHSPPVTIQGICRASTAVYNYGETGKCSNSIWINVTNIVSTVIAAGYQLSDFKYKVGVIKIKVYLPQGIDVEDVTHSEYVEEESEESVVFWRNVKYLVELARRGVTLMGTITNGSAPWIMLELALMAYEYYLEKVVLPSVEVTVTSEDGYTVYEYSWEGGGAGATWTGRFSLVLLQVYTDALSLNTDVTIPVWIHVGIGAVYQYPWGPVFDETSWYEGWVNGVIRRAVQSQPGEEYSVYG